MDEILFLVLYPYSQEVIEYSDFLSPLHYQMSLIRIEIIFSNILHILFYLKMLGLVLHSISHQSLLPFLHLLLVYDDVILHPKRMHLRTNILFLVLYLEA